MNFDYTIPYYQQIYEWYNYFKYELPHDVRNFGRSSNTDFWYTLYYQKSKIIEEFRKKFTKPHNEDICKVFYYKSKVLNELKHLNKENNQESGWSLIF